MFFCCFCEVLGFISFIFIFKILEFNFKVGYFPISRKELILFMFFVCLFVELGLPFSRIVFLLQVDEILRDCVEISVLYFFLLPLLWHL